MKKEKDFLLDKINQLESKINHLTMRIQQTGNKNEVLKQEKRELELYKNELEDKLGREYERFS